MIQIKVTILQMLYLENFSSCMAGRHGEELKAIAEKIVALKKSGKKVVYYNPAAVWFGIIGPIVLALLLIYFKVIVPYLNPGIYFP